MIDRRIEVALPRHPHPSILRCTVGQVMDATDKARHNILGGNAARLFRLPPRNEAQRQNLIKYGNLSA